MAGVFDSFLGKSTFSITPLKYDASSGSLSVEKNSFIADALIQENETRGVSITNYPLENGGSFAEHAAQLAFNITINGVISDSSMSYFDTLTSIGSSPLGQLVGFESKTQAAYNLLTGWAETGQPLLVKTKYKKDGYKDKSGAYIPFVVESFSIQRTPTSGSAIHFSMSLRQIFLISISKNLTSISPIPPGAIPTITDKGAAAASSNLKAGSAQAANPGAVDSGFANIIKNQAKLLQTGGF